MTNTIKRVVRYVADDGTEHETYVAARKHNTTHALESWLAEFFYNLHYGTEAECADLAAALRRDWNISKRKEKTK